MSEARRKDSWKTGMQGIYIALLLCSPVWGYSQTLSTDIDGDGIGNASDNCSTVANPNQIDTDGDGFGNRCDGDLNNDLIVNFLDVPFITSQFLQMGTAADLNTDGIVNFLDLSAFAAQFLQRPGPSGVAASAYDFVLTPVFAGITVGQSIDMRQPASQPGRWYLLQRGGILISFSSDPGTTTSVVSMNISSSVDTTFEGGALGFAFDPEFVTNGYLYVSYTTTGPGSGTPLISRLSRFETTLVDGVSIGDPLSEVVLLSVDQPFSNHNGGNIAFDDDGYLYWGLGDGGSFGDPMQNGQDKTNLLAAMLRLDVNVSQADIDMGITYKIPPSNPFSANTDCTVACPEIFAWGLRNPWRWSFDRLTQKLWVGDVGQNTVEEISVVASGDNLGWRCYEGNLVYNLTGCDLMADFKAPVYTYPRSDGSSVTGGFVYRGQRYPVLHGMYFYADYGSGSIWGLFESDYAGELISTAGLSFVSFAEDAQGELFVMTLPFVGNGQIYRIDAN